jgi:glycosidase
MERPKLISLMTCAVLWCCFVTLFLADATQIPEWLEDGVIYGVSPFYMNSNSTSSHGTLKMVTQRLHEIAALGVTTVWVQPIFPTANGGEAYDVTDYMNVWPALGDLADVTELVETAHRLKLKVLLDVVLDHTSKEHPFALDVQQNGNQSRYRSFYMDHNAPGFGDMQHNETIGNGTFVYFFNWPYLLNVNYTGCLTYMQSVLEFWVVKFDFDGFRCDAMWGVLMRSFAEAKALVDDARKARKDPIFILAESGAGDALAGEAGFDATYDWGPDIGHWAWDPVLGVSSWANLTVDAIREVVNLSIDSKVPIVRFVENNDQKRFLSGHTIHQTRAAATLMFTLPGIPMMFYGEEIGASDQFPTYPMDRTIRSYDRNGWYDFFKILISLRKNPALRPSSSFMELKASDSSVYTFLRNARGSPPVIVVFNTSEKSIVTNINVSPLMTKYTHWVDEITSETVKSSCEHQELQVPVRSHQVLVLVAYGSCT